MEEAPETTETPTNRMPPWLRWVTNSQILITLPTLVISIALAYFSFVQADSSPKMQRTETWPYVSYGTDNSLPEVMNEISFSLSDDGVGPARLNEMEFLYNGRPMREPLEYIRLCCGAEAKASTKNLTFTTDRVDGVLRPGEKRNFIKLAKTDQNAALWDKLNDERWKVVVRTCYCSIFDDCWVLDSRKSGPDEVEACPADWTKFQERSNTPKTSA
jgi:hypothetical protein